MSERERNRLYATLDSLWAAGFNKETLAATAQKIGLDEWRPPNAS